VHCGVRYVKGQLLSAAVSADDNGLWTVVGWLVSMSAMPEHIIYQWNYAVFS